MSALAPEWLPPLMRLDHCGGDPSTHLEAVYARFRAEFCESRPQFRGDPVRIKRHPMHHGKEASFWHCVTSGPLEDERLPDLRRYERIPWLRPVIEASGTVRVRTWRNTRGRGGERVVIALPDFSFVVVLAVRSGYYVLWTAYPVERNHRRAKLRGECERWEAQNS